jgi:pilus assembly protein FimV
VDSELFDLGDLDVDLSISEDAPDEISTKLDLARAYVEMGDKEGAADILDEVLAEGDAAQKEEAQKIKDSIA